MLCADALSSSGVSLPLLISSIGLVLGAALAAKTARDSWVLPAKATAGVATAGAAAACVRAVLRLWPLPLSSAA